MTFCGVRRLAALIVVNLGAALATASPVGSVVSQHPVAAPASATSAGPGVGDAFGDARAHGSMAGTPLTQPVVGIASTLTGNGYWLVARDGGIFSFGDAAFHGSTGAVRLNQPIVGITRTPGGRGYWFVASDGGVFSFGDARFKGSTGGITLNQPIVGMAATRSGSGYWLVARDGGIFSFGDAAFHGSTGGITLNQPIVGMAATPSGKGYWLVSADGGVFAFGDAGSLGSASGRSGQPVVGIAPAAGGDGYWLASTDGAVFSFGDAGEYGSGSATSPVVGIAPTPSGNGFWLTTSAGDVLSTVSAPVGSDSYSFLRIGGDGKPVRYNPCAPVDYVINPALAPLGGVDEVKTAFQRLAAATGIGFVFEGTTTEPHVRFGERQIYQRARYGDRWAPILISWSTELVEPLLAGGTLGYGGSTSYWAGDSDEAYITGEVVFDVVDDVLHAGFGVGLSRGNLTLHELGHVVGLDHVDDGGEVMHRSIHPETNDGYAAGDLAGLALLGARQGCLDVANPPGSLL